MKRHHHHDRREELGRDRHLENPVARAIENRGQLGVAARGQRDDQSAPRLHFLHVADHLFEHVILRCEKHDRHPVVDQRDRPMLHFARRIAFGVDVRNLLQLQRAFERDRVVDSAAQVEEVGPVVEPAGDLLDCRGELQRLLEQLGQLQQRVDVRLRRLGGQHAARLTETSPSRYSATSCDVKALVDATPISGPACV